jgi:hypothetical protein
MSAVGILNDSLRKVFLLLHTYSLLQQELFYIPVKICAAAARYMSIDRSVIRQDVRRSVTSRRIVTAIVQTSLDGSAQQCTLIFHYLHRLSMNLNISAALPDPTVYMLTEE